MKLKYVLSHSMIIYPKELISEMYGELYVEIFGEIYIKISEKLFDEVSSDLCEEVSLGILTEISKNYDVLNNQDDKDFKSKNDQHDKESEQHFTEKKVTPTKINFMANSCIKILAIKDGHLYEKVIAKEKIDVRKNAKEILIKTEDYDNSDFSKLTEAVNMTEFHRNEIKQILDQEYSCNVCNYKTKLKGSMKQHNESIHGSTFYSCDQCNYKFWMKE